MLMIGYHTNPVTDTDDVDDLDSSMAAGSPYNSSPRTASPLCASDDILDNQVTPAGSPYNSSPITDIVLRTSDDVDFYVIGPILCFVSPVFMDMYTLNSGPATEEAEKKDGHPLIRLEEDSRTLRLLLDIIYPYGKARPLTNVSLFWKVGRASKKYIMGVVEEKLQDWVISFDLITTSPLRIYAIAIDLEWEGIAIEAARRTLGIPLQRLGYVEELRSIPASEFYRFLEYRLRCNTSSSPNTETLMKFPARDSEGTTKPRDWVHDDDTTAPEPFHSSKESDLILRSSDFVDFFVLRPLIYFVSPEFDEVFPSRRKTDDGKILIQVTQDSKVLHQLLRIVYCYIDEPDICDFQLYISVAKAVQDYKMATIEKRLWRLALNSPLIVNEPLKIYVLATALGWEDVAKLAALNTLSLPLQEMTYIEELNRITGEDLYRLVNFRFKCGDAACELLEADAEFMQFGPSNWNKFWSKLISVSMEDLKEQIKACPRGSTLDDIYADTIWLLEHQSSENLPGNKCSLTSAQAAKIMRCYKHMGDIIEQAVLKVPFNFPLCAKGRVTK